MTHSEALGSIADPGMRLRYPPFSGGQGGMGCKGNHRPVTGNARWGRPQGEKRGWPREEPVSILFTVDRPIVTSPKNKSGAIEKTSRLAGQFVTSWLRLFPRAEHFLPQATAPARAAVWSVPAAAPLAATEHGRCGPHCTRENGPFASRY